MPLGANFQEVSWDERLLFVAVLGVTLGSAGIGGATTPASAGALCTLSAPYNFTWNNPNSLFHFKFDVSCPGGGTPWHTSARIQKQVTGGWVSAFGPYPGGATGSLIGVNAWVPGTCNPNTVYRAWLENTDNGVVKVGPTGGKQLAC